MNRIFNLSRSYVENPRRIRYQVDSYLKDIINFKGITRNPPKEFRVPPNMVKTRELYIGIPKKTTLEQLLEIQKSGINAQKNNIKLTLRIEE